MSLEAFSLKINELAKEKRIGVSHRISLCDEGVALGLKRSAIDKMIDEALAIAREEGKKETSAPAFSIPDVPEPQISSIPTPTSLNFEHSSNETKRTNRKVEEKEPMPDDPALDLFEEEHLDYDPLEDLPGSDDKPTLQDLLEEIRKEKSHTQEESPFEQTKKEEFVYEFGESFEEFKTNGVTPGIYLDYATYGLIAGIVSVLFSGFSFIAVFAGIGASYLHTEGMKKINQQSPGYYSKQSKDLLNVGRLLGFIGSGIFILTRIF